MPVGPELFPPHYLRYLNCNQLNYVITVSFINATAKFDLVRQTEQEVSSLFKNPRYNQINQ